MKRLILAALVALAPASAAAAPCEGFAWPMAREKAAFEAASAEVNPAGTTLGAWPAAAETLSLGPGGETDFPMAPERAPKEGTQSGFIVLPAPPAAGLYQVTLNAKAWIDVVQDGKAVKSGEHSSDRDCPIMRKSVRFDLAAAPVTLQFSGADATSVTFTILPAAE